MDPSVSEATSLKQWYVHATVVLSSHNFSFIGTKTEAKLLQ